MYPGNDVYTPPSSPSDVLPSLPSSPSSSPERLQPTPLLVEKQSISPLTVVSKPGLSWADAAKEKRSRRAENLNSLPDLATQSFRVDDFPKAEYEGAISCCRRRSSRQVSWSELVQDLCTTTSLSMREQAVWSQTLLEVVEHEKDALQCAIEHLIEENAALDDILYSDYDETTRRDGDTFSNAIACLADCHMRLSSRTMSVRLSVESMARVSNIAQSGKFVPAMSLRGRMEHLMAQSVRSVPEIKSELGIHERILASVRSPSSLTSPVGNIVRFPVTKLNRFHRNSHRSLELNLVVGSVAVLKPQATVFDSKTESSSRPISRSTPAPVDFCSEELLLSPATIVSAELCRALEMKVDYLVPSAKLLRKQKCFRVLFESASSRECCYRLLKLHILKPQHRSKKAFAPQLLSHPPQERMSSGSQSIPFAPTRSTLKFATISFGTSSPRCSTVASHSSHSSSFATNPRSHARSQRSLLSASFAAPSPSPPPAPAASAESRDPSCRRHDSSRFPIDVLAQLSHRAWTCERLSDGWSYESNASSKHRTHPDLLLFDELPESVKEKKRDLVRGTCDAILALGFSIQEPRFQDPLMCLEELDGELPSLVELLAENVHHMWAHGLLKSGWKFGSQLNFSSKHHPNLVPFSELGDWERSCDRQIVSHVLGSLLELGYRVKPNHSPTINSRPKNTFQPCLSA